MLSNNLAVVSQLYFERPAVENSVAGAWLGAICFSLQIYYDFSGYSDMAIGLGRCLDLSLRKISIIRISPDQ